MYIKVKDLNIFYKFQSIDSSYLRKSILQKLLKKNNNSKKEIEVFHALKNIKFELFKGDRLGIIGPNGSGKSTLIRALSTILYSENNTVQLHGKFLPIIEPWSLAESTDTVENNIILIGLLFGYKKKYIISQIDKILNFAEIEKWRNNQFNSLSTGMGLRLIFSIMFNLKTEIFLIDEFLSTGDEKFRTKAFDHLKNISKDTIIAMCSHSRDQIKQLCNKLLILKNGEQIFFGDVEQGYDKYDQILKEEK